MFDSTQPCWTVDGRTVTVVDKWPTTMPAVPATKQGQHLFHDFVVGHVQFQDSVYGGLYCFHKETGQSLDPNYRGMDLTNERPR